MNTTYNITAKTNFKLSLFTLLTLFTQIFIVLFFQEILYNEPAQFWSPIKVIIFDIATYFVWCSLGFLILKKARKEIDFKILKKTKHLCVMQWLAIILLISLTFYASYIHWHGVKIIKAYILNGFSVFIFQHILYIIEAFLITMFMNFLQNYLDIAVKKPYIPYLGILFSIICFIIAIQLHAPFATAIYLTFLSFLFGSVYLLCNKNFINTFLLILFLLII